MRLVNQPWLRSTIAYLPGVALFSLLALLAVAGHASHWKLSALLPSSWRSAGPTAESAPASEKKPDPPDAPVHFDSEEALERTGIRTAAVEKRALVQTVAANGTVDYDHTRLAHLSPRTAGHVWKVYRHVGDPVRRGDALGLIDAAEVGKAKAELLQAFVAVVARSTAFEHARSTWQSGALPERTYLEQQTALSEARIRLANTQQALLNLGLPVRLEAFAHAPPEQLSRQIRLAGLPAAVTATLDPEVATANLLPLIAPFDGVVTHCDMVEGEVVASDKPVFVVADVRRVWVILDVRQEDAGRLAVGQLISFRPDGASLEAAGRLSWIATEVDPKTRTVQARAELDNTAGQLRAQSFGSGRITVAARPEAVTVPTAAVQWDGSRALVFVRRDDGLSFEPREVNTGLRDGDYTEVLDGVRPGDIVATAGSHVLKSELFERVNGGDKD